MKVFLPFLLLPLVACSRARSYSTLPPVLGAASIGPAGGEVVVAEGKQAGLRLVVPAGAISETVEVRIVDVPIAVPPVLQVTSVAPPGEPFRIEPAGLRFETAATLRVPYRIERVTNTSPGNVRAQQVGTFGTRNYEPHTVDVVNGYLAIDIKTVGQFQVITGPRAEGLTPYFPAVDSTVQLDGGVTFQSEAVAAGSRFSSLASFRWRIRNGLQDDALYFDAGSLRGRESSYGNWQEVWNEPYPAWQTIESAGAGVTGTTRVFQPIGNQVPVGGQIVVWGYWYYAEPRQFGNRLPRGERRHDAALLRQQQPRRRAAGDEGVPHRQAVGGRRPRAGQGSRLEGPGAAGGRQAEVIARR